MNEDPTRSLAAAVLIGGKSSRMGRDKAFLVWQGERLVDRQLRLVDALRPRQRFLSARADNGLVVPGVETVTDRIAERGPVGALDALMHRMETTHLLVVAVDMPFLTTEVLGHLWARCTVGSGVVPMLAGRWEPLAAFYPAACAARLPALLLEGRAAMRDLIEPAIVAGELIPWTVPREWAGAFANWNRPEDLPVEAGRP